MNTFCHTLFISLLMCIQVMNTFAQKPASQEIPDSATIGEPAAQPFHPLRFAGRKLVSSVTLPDSADIIKNQKKNIWRAGAEVIGFNIGLNAFDRYVLNGRYAQISWNTIKNNFSHGFEWDNDHLNTNMFAHPYNGSLYFNAGRSNGFNFWQSELFAIGGSAMWEMCMEREYPSTNDIIATPIGGAAIGEVLYRTSDMITDDRTSGGERFGRELAAFVINPTRGLTRILTGDAWKRRSTSGRRFGIPPVSMNVSLGGRYLALWDNDEGTQAGAVAEIEIEYGRMWVEIIISDRGKGIDKKQKKHIWEPFNSSKNSSTNWGIGMYFTRRVIKRHFGSISFSPRKDGGTSFMVMLPLAGEENK